MQNKQLKKIFEGIYTENILNKEIECHLEITQGDKFDIVKIKDSIKNTFSIGELSEILLSLIASKWDLKTENIIWVEDFSDVNETMISSENLSLVKFDDSGNVIEKNNFSDEEYNKYFTELTTELKVKKEPAGPKNRKAIPAPIPTPVIETAVIAPSKTTKINQQKPKEKIKLK